MSSRIWFNRPEAEEAFTEEGKPKMDFGNAVQSAKAHQASTREATIKYAELDVLEGELWKCYYREGVNHVQKCKHLATAYLDRLQEHNKILPSKPLAQ